VETYINQVNTKSDKELRAATDKLYNFMGIGVLLAGVISYAILFKSYKNALEKHHQMTELLYNPNARVASGKRAKQILKHMKKDKQKK